MKTKNAIYCLFFAIFSMACFLQESASDAVANSVSEIEYPTSTAASPAPHAKNPTVGYKCDGVEMPDLSRSSVYATTNPSVESVYVRSCPDTGSDIIGVMSPDDIFVSGNAVYTHGVRCNKWMPVLVKGVAGWVCADFVRADVFD